VNNTGCMLVILYRVPTYFHLSIHHLRYMAKRDNHLWIKEKVNVLNSFEPPEQQLNTSCILPALYQTPTRSPAPTLMHRPSEAAHAFVSLSVVKYLRLKNLSYVWHAWTPPSTQYQTTQLIQLCNKLCPAERESQTQRGVCCVLIWSNSLIWQLMNTPWEIPPLTQE
jgi:hypothetical protein